MSLPTPLPLVTQLASQRWVHAQIFGITDKRLIRLDLVGAVRHAVVATRGVPRMTITFTRAFTAVSNSDWMTWDPSHPYRFPSHVSPRLQPIGPHRLAIIAPGAETTTCILFGEEDDGRQEEVFPGFALGPIDLDQIVCAIATPDSEQSIDTPHA